MKRCEICLSVNCRRYRTRRILLIVRHVWLCRAHAAPAVREAWRRIGAKV